MNKLLFLLSLLVFKTSASDPFAGAIDIAVSEAVCRAGQQTQQIWLEASRQIGVLVSEGVSHVDAINIAHTLAKDKIALLAQGSMELIKKSGGIEMAVEGVRIGTDLVSHMEFNAMFKGQSECLATLGKKTAQLSIENPKTTATIVGVGVTGAFLYNYVSSMDPQKVDGVVLMGYGALNLLADAKDKLKKMIGIIEKEEERIRGEQPIIIDHAAEGESSSNFYTIPSIPGERLSILYELQMNNAKSRMIFAQINN